MAYFLVTVKGTLVKKFVAPDEDQALVMAEQDVNHGELDGWDMTADCNVTDVELLP